MESCLHLRINAGEGKRLGGIINTSWIPQPIFVAKKGQTFSKIRQGKSDRSVSLNQMESGVVFSTNWTDACGAKSGWADRGGRTRPTRKEPIMNLLRTWNPLPEREDIQNRLTKLPIWRRWPRVPRMSGLHHRQRVQNPILADASALLSPGKTIR